MVPEDPKFFQGQNGSFSTCADYVGSYPFQTVDNNEHQGNDICSGGSIRRLIIHQKENNREGIE